MVSDDYIILVPQITLIHHTGVILLLLPFVKYNIIVYYKLNTESDLCIDVKYNQSFIDQTSADGKSMTR